MLTQHPSSSRSSDAGSNATSHATDRRSTGSAARRATAGRVLHIVDAGVPGVGRHVVDLSRQLAEQGWDVDVAYVASGVECDFPDRLAGLESDIKEVLRLEPGRGLRTSRRRTLRTLRRFVRRRGHHIVHGHGLRGGTWSQLAAAGSTARTVHTPNPLTDRWPDLGPTRRSAARHLEAGLSPLTDHLIHLSAAEAHHSERLGLLPVSWSVIPAGVDPVVVPTRDEARAELGLPVHQRADDPITIGWVGSLDEHTDLPLALHAHARLGHRTAQPAELVVVGDGLRRGDLAALAERLADRVGGPGQVRFVGDHEPAVAMAAFDVFLLPSDRGGFPYPLLEAMWAGVRCVSAPNPAAETLLGDTGEVGRCSTDRGPAALADALAPLVERNPRATSGAARRHAERLTNQRVAGEITSIYRRLLGVEAELSLVTPTSPLEPAGRGLTAASRPR